MACVDSPVVLPKVEVECSVCGHSAQSSLVVQLQCEDVYCKPCLKSFFLRVAKNEALFPPKCHGKPIDFSLIATDLSIGELCFYREAEQEFTCKKKLYCANVECSKFIPLSQRNSDCAFCKRCGTNTCVHCKGLYHGGGCPADQERQRLIKLGIEEGWKICCGCGEMVFRSYGCDHMT